MVKRTIKKKIKKAKESSSLDGEMNDPKQTNDWHKKIAGVTSAGEGNLRALDGHF